MKTTRRGGGAASMFLNFLARFVFVVLAFLHISHVRMYLTHPKQAPATPSIFTFLSRHFFFFFRIIRIILLTIVVAFITLACFFPCFL